SKETEENKHLPFLDLKLCRKLRWIVTVQRSSLCPIPTNTKCEFFHIFCRMKLYIKLIKQRIVHKTGRDKSYMFLVIALLFAIPEVIFRGYFNYIIFDWFYLCCIMLHHLDVDVSSILWLAKEPPNKSALIFWFSHMMFPNILDNLIFLLSMEDAILFFNKSTLILRSIFTNLHQFWTLIMLNYEGFVLYHVKVKTLHG
ncbi:hypothetical protein L9F63_012221, partial [Diploptera punctata]